MKEFEKYRREKDPEHGGSFCRTIPEVIAWLEKLVEERCDMQIVRLIRNMMRLIPEERPSAESVWETLTACTSTTGQIFCGPCCMPHLPGDPLLDENAHEDLSLCRYASSEPVYNTTIVPDDLSFQTSFETGQGPGLQHVRNVRYWDNAVLDIVRGKSPYKHARKRFYGTEENRRAVERAMNEAEILRNVKHKHIVALRSTYKNPNMLTLHFKPAADFDLRTFLDLTELRLMRSRSEGSYNQQL